MLNPHPATRRAQTAFDENRVICETCGLTFQHYWRTLAMMHQARMPLAGAPTAAYGFAPTDVMTQRVPMCRSAQARCEGMRQVLKIRYGDQIGEQIAMDLTPLTIH